MDGLLEREQHAQLWARAVPFFGWGLGLDARSTTQDAFVKSTLRSERQGER